MTDPRLVAALAAALDEAWVTEDGGDSEQFAAAILPAFLADPRTAGWLAERLDMVMAYEVDDEPWMAASDAAAILRHHQPRGDAMTDKYRWLVTIRPGVSIGPARYVETVETDNLDPTEASCQGTLAVQRRHPDNQMWQSDRVEIIVERIP